MNREDSRALFPIEEGIFFQEWLAAGQPPEQLSISAVCNARCLFCSNRMNPFPITQNVFRDIEDVKLQLSLCSADYAGAIHMSESLPGRISEGEAFLHPQFFEILTLVREKFLTNHLHFTTNASLLDEPLVRKLAEFRPIEINVSLHSTEPKLWARILQSTERRAQSALKSLGLLKKHHIDFTGTIVPLPRICGWDDLEKTFGFLVAEGAKSIILWWPGFSERTPEELKKEMECPWEEFQAFVKRMQEKFPKVPLSPQPNLADPLRLPIKRIMHSTLQGNLKTFGGEFRTVLWLVSESAYPEISRMVEECAKDVSNTHHVFPIKNRSYGGNINVSGLLMVSDFLAAGKEALERWPATDLVLIPQRAFDAFFRDLKKIPAYKIPESLGRTTWLIFENGAFRPLKGRGFVRPENLVNKPFEKILKFFYQAIQEDKFADLSSLVVSFPIPTSEGVLQEGEFLEFLKRAKSRLSRDANFEKRMFEKLDDNRVLCMEDWPTEDPSTIFSRWFFFRKIGSDWKVEQIFLGQGAIDQEKKPAQSR